MQEPRLVVEFEEQGEGSGSAASPPVIRRLRVPNSPIGGYGFCSGLMTSALAAVEALR